MSVRLAVGQVREVSGEIAQFAKQLGVNSIQLNTPIIDDSNGRWEYEELLNLRLRCEALGLTLEALENVPLSFMREIMLGLPGRDEAISRYCETIQNMGRAGIFVLGHNFSPNFVWRTSLSTPGRGGSQVTCFSADDVPQGNAVIWPQVDIDYQIDRQTLWLNYELFLQRVLPVAEEAGVRLALHPDDPPVHALGTFPRLFYSVEMLYRAYELSGGSSSWGLQLCLGTISEMEGGAAAVKEAIQLFGGLSRIVYVHFRDVKGTVPSFREAFIGEGNFDPHEIMRMLLAFGFDGFIIDDHVPRMSGDTDWGQAAHAHALGYLQGLISVAEASK